MEYAELHCFSNFSFLEGASHPEDLVARAASLGYAALAITDRDGLYAAVRLDVAAREHGLAPIFGAEVTLEDQHTLTLLARDVEGYQNLSRLLSAGRLSRPKGQSSVTYDVLAHHAKGLIALTGTFRGRIPRALFQGQFQQARDAADRLLSLFGQESVFLEVSDHCLPAELIIRQGLLALSRDMDLPLVATQDARYAAPEGRPLQDVLTCIRLHTSLPEAGTRLLPNGEYYLQPRDVLAHRFRALPQALRNTLLIAEQCDFSLSQLHFDLPSFPVPAAFPSALEYLEHLTFLRAPERFPELNAKVVQQLRHELQIIGRLGLEGYFLIVWDIVRFCHEQGILAQGRGSAANSAVCFALGITNVDPIRHQLLFERFLSEGRRDAPDIDLDIANNRREEVIQYVYQRYGRAHAGMVCEIISYRARSAVREVGKALGLSLEQVDRLAKNLESRRFRPPEDAAASAGSAPASGGIASGPAVTSPPASAAARPAPAGVLPSSPLKGPSPALPSPAPLVDLSAPLSDGSLEVPVPPDESDLEPSTYPGGSTSEGPAFFPGLTADPSAAEKPSALADTPGDPAAPASNPAGPDAPPEPEPPPLDPDEARAAHWLWTLCQQIDGFPRHLGIHVGGMVICAQPLSSLVPLENASMADRTVIQWDKDDIGALRMAKIDLLGLGMLSLIGEAIALVEKHEQIRLDPARLTYDDSRVYDLLCEADTVGVFQVESRAQMNVLPRLKPRRFYDLVVQVALIRPGPIQGQMVHPYLRRRAGLEPVTYPHPDLKPILERTLGVSLFQEQGMKVAVVAGGFSPSEADSLRRAMASKRSKVLMEQLMQKLYLGMQRNGYDQEIAVRVVSQIQAFADYGFPESHAASFALLVYISAYLKCYHPRAFYAALLNNQPMGFYSPATIVNEAQRRGVRVLPVDVVRSSWTWTLEGRALRAGLKSVKGLGEEHERLWEEARARGPWRSVEDVCARTGWPKLVLERLAAIGAFASLRVDRRQALWKVQGFRPRPGLASVASEEPRATLRPVNTAEALTLDLTMKGHSVESHPIALMRPQLDRWQVRPSRELDRVADKASLRVAGVVSVRQRPPTAKGFCFLTLEDEHGMMNIVVRPDRYEAYRPVVRQALILLVEGVLQRQHGVVNIMAEKLAALDERWAAGLRSRDFH